MRLLLLLTTAVLPGANAFVVPRSRARRSIAFVPSSATQPSTSTTSLSSISSKIKEGTDLVNLFKDLDDLAHYDPEDDDADFKLSAAILDITQRVLEKVVEKEEQVEEKAVKDLRGIISLVKMLVDYYKTSGAQETMEFAEYPPHSEV
jgi:hypothetical protein